MWNEDEDGALRLVGSSMKEEEEIASVKNGRDARRLGS